MRFFKLFSLLTLAVLLVACSEEDPSVRIQNDLEVKANVQLKPDAGNTININDVAAGTTSAEVTVQEGRWTATASVQSKSGEYTVAFDVKNDVRYTVVIVNAETPVLEVRTEDK